MTRSLEAGRRCSWISCSLLKTPAAAIKRVTAERHGPDSHSTATGRHTQHPVPSAASRIQARATAPYGTTEEEAIWGRVTVWLCLFLTCSSEDALFSSESKTKALIKSSRLLALFHLSIWEK